MYLPYTNFTSDLSRPILPAPLLPYQRLVSPVTCTCTCLLSVRMPFVSRKYIASKAVCALLRARATLPLLFNYVKDLSSIEEWCLLFLIIMFSFRGGGFVSNIEEEVLKLRILIFSLNTRVVFTI